ncbi:MAG: universal stress protein [Flavobacteriales bacterium]|nr:universal stress protein [Flavobacteriales bacterium]
MNETFEHILIPFDNSESARVALRTAVNLSQRFDARLTMVCVNSDDDLERKVKKIIEKIKRRTDKDVIYIRPSGRVFSEVVDAAKSLGSDLIIMGTHGTSGVQDFFIGSNAYRVVSSSPVPVLTMRESFIKDSFDRIVIPMDDSSESRQKIPMVKKMASYFQSRVYVLATSKWDDEDTQNRVTRYSEQAVEMLTEQGIECKMSSHFGGNIANATMDYGDKVGADLIIAMSETEPAAGFFMGANAQRLVNHSEIPILTIHAEEVLKGITGY